jgi:thermolabile hemolysin
MHPIGGVISFMRVQLPIFAVSLFLPLSSAFAIPVNSINQLFLFGDSLSDSGNASIATLGAEPGSGGYYYRSVSGLPYQVGEFTNAPTPGGPTGVWADQFAPKLGLPVAQPFLAGGTNFAIASAMTGSNGLDGVTDQLGYFKAAVGSTAPSNALYAFWAGANDVANGGNPITAADSLSQNILTLSAAGAKTFLWFNLPDLGKTPDALAAGPVQSALASAASNAFDNEWALDLSRLQSLGIDVIGVDVASEFLAIQADPAAFGFTNLTTPAISVPGANPNQYLFFDGEHPTAAADALIADLAFTDLVDAPEPAALTLAALGIAMVALLGRKARREI